MSKDESYIFWWIIVIVLLLIGLSSNSNSNPYDTCYDADPTQYTDMVCD